MPPLQSRVHVGRARDRRAQSHGLENAARASCRRSAFSFCFRVYTQTRPVLFRMSLCPIPRSGPGFRPAMYAHIFIRSKIWGEGQLGVTITDIHSGVILELLAPPNILLEEEELSFYPLRILFSNIKNFIIQWKIIFKSLLSMTFPLK